MKLKFFSLFILAAVLLIACQSKSSKSDSHEAVAPATTIGGLPWAGNKDVVCGMKIDQTAEDTLHYHGTVYGFCSESCKETFQENPEKFVSK